METLSQTTSPDAVDLPEWQKWEVLNPRRYREKTGLLGSICTPNAMRDLVRLKIIT